MRTIEIHKSTLLLVTSLLIVLALGSCDELDEDLSLAGSNLEDVQAFKLTQPSTSVLFDLQSGITSETILTIDSNPEHGTLELLEGRFLKYSPENVFSGLDNFKISTTSSGVSSSKELSVQMNDGTKSLPANFQALSDYYYFNVNERTEIIFNPLLNDGYDPALVTSVNIIFDQISSGELLQHSNTELKYTPTADFFGIESFIYTLEVELISGESYSSSAQVVINVTNYDKPCVRTKWRNLYLEFFTPFEETYAIQILNDQPGCVEAISTQITNINDGTAVLSDDHRFIVFTPPSNAQGKDIKINYLVELPDETLSLEIGINMLEP